MIPTNDWPLPVKIKICGVTSPETAVHAMNAGATAIGLMFYPPSKRNLMIEQAVAINRVIKPFVSRVGVVVNPQRESLTTILDSVELDYIQFHGDEPAEFCRSFGLPYIKAARVGRTLDLPLIEEQYPDARAILLDSQADGVYGGSGQSFDWRSVPCQGRKPVVLAGGLTPGNVEQAISLVRPYAVDVSSGVETDGRKDLQKITRFCANVLNGCQRPRQSPEAGTVR